MVEFVGLSEDMIAMLSIHGPDDPTQGYWKVAKVEVQPKTDNMSAFAIIREAGPFVAEFFWDITVQRTNSKTDPYAPEGAKANAASMPMFNAWGSYGIRIVDNSEEIFGFGLYGDNLELTHTAHHPVLICFEWHEGEEPPPPPPPPPNGDVRLVSEWMESGQAQTYLHWLVDGLSDYLMPELGDFLKTLTIEVSE